MTRRLTLGLALLLQLAPHAVAHDLPAEITAYLQKAIVSEAGYPSGTEEEVVEFTVYLKKNWVAVLTDIETIAPDARRQKLIAAGAEFLPGSDYLLFLSGLLDKYQAGKVSKSAVVDAILANGKKSGFLACNHQHPTVRALCERVQTVFPDEASLQQSMTDILSGAQKRQAELAAFNEGRPKPELLPVSPINQPKVSTGPLPTPKFNSPTDPKLITLRRLLLRPWLEVNNEVEAFRQQTPCRTCRACAPLRPQRSWRNCFLPTRKRIMSSRQSMAKQACR